MKAQKKISFNYHQNVIQRLNNQPCLQTHHLVNSQRILKFNYQLPFQPIQRIKTNQSFSYETHKLSNINTDAEPKIEARQSFRGSKKINLVIIDKKREKEKVKNLPQLLQQVIDSQHQHSVCQQIVIEDDYKKQKVKGKVQVDLNPQSKYLYLVPSHIQQQNCDINCDLFSACKQPVKDQRQSYKPQDEHLDIGRQFTNSQIIPDQNQFVVRQKIFQAISSFNVPLQRERKSSSFSSNQWEDLDIKPRATQNLPQRTNRNTMKRRRLFSEIQPPRPRIFKISQMQINNEDIPQQIRGKWQMDMMNNLKEWHGQSPTLNASPQVHRERIQQC